METARTDCYNILKRGQEYKPCHLSAASMLLESDHDCDFTIFGYARNGLNGDQVNLGIERL
jgi:hypothetical protein